MKTFENPMGYQLLYSLGGRNDYPIKTLEAAQHEASKYLKENPREIKVFIVPVGQGPLNQSDFVYIVYKDFYVFGE